MDNTSVRKWNLIGGILCAATCAVLLIWFYRALKFDALSRSIIYQPIISDNGNYIAFASLNSRRVKNDEGSQGLYVYDVAHGFLHKGSSDFSHLLFISNDGRFVYLDGQYGKAIGRLNTSIGSIDRITYDSLPSKIKDSIENSYTMSPSTNSQNVGKYQVRSRRMRIRDAKKGTIMAGMTEILDHGQLLFRVPAIYARLSKDGKVLAYISNDGQAYVARRGQRRPLCISKAPNGKVANFPCTMINMTPDGRKIVFTSQATNLTRKETPFAVDVFRYDLESDELTCVSYDR